MLMMINRGVVSDGTDCERGMNEGGWMTFEYEDGSRYGSKRVEMEE